MITFLYSLFFIILYSTGILSDVSIPQIIPECALIVIPIMLICASRYHLKLAPGWHIALIYLVWAILASHYHNDGLIRAMLFSRYILIGYLIFWATYNSGMSIKSFENITKIIFLLFFLQIPVSLYEILIIGRTEGFVGTLTRSGGGTATTFPIFAFSFMYSFFLYKNRWIYLILGSLFMIVGYASGKLGVYILLLFHAGIGYALFMYLNHQPMISARTLKYISSLLLIAFAGLLILPTADIRTARLSMQSQSIVDRAKTFFDYASQGEFESVYSSYTTSRSATSLRVITETLHRPPSTFLFGQGFNAYSESSGLRQGYRAYGIDYGITGWAYDALVYGWPLMFLHVLLYSFYLIKLLKMKITVYFSPFLKVLWFSLILNSLFFFINYFFYNYSYSVGGWIIYVHLFFVGILLSINDRSIRHNKIKVLTKMGV